MTADEEFVEGLLQERDHTRQKARLEKESRDDSRRLLHQHRQSYWKALCASLESKIAAFNRRVPAAERLCVEAEPGTGRLTVSRAGRPGPVLICALGERHVLTELQAAPGPRAPVLDDYPFELRGGALRARGHDAEGLAREVAAPFLRLLLGLGQ
jgi:hypothetical protein